MLAIRTGRIEIPSGTGSRTVAQMVLFSEQKILACHVGLGGYEVRYDSGDHEIKTLEVALSCGLEKTEFGPGVQVRATLHLRDKNGDDPFSGWVDFVLFAELAAFGSITHPKMVDLHLVIQ